MYLFKKIKSSDGKRAFYLFGIKIHISQKKKTSIKADLSCNKISIPSTGKYKITIHGKNNEIYINTENIKSSLDVSIYGDNNKIHIDTTESIHLNGIIGDSVTKTDNTTLKIENGTSINGLQFYLMDNNSSIQIGKNCMISWDVEIWASDTHSILDENNNLINLGKEIIIGDSVWIGKDVKILKNSIIPDGCIVGMGSIVSKKFTTNNAILVGIPAKIVKENISWSQKRPNEFLK